MLLPNRIQPHGSSCFLNLNLCVELRIEHRVSYTLGECATRDLASAKTRHLSDLGTSIRLLCGVILQQLSNVTGRAEVAKSGL